jgi:hypothetical protein
MESLGAQREPVRPMLWRRRLAEILAPVSPSTTPEHVETWLVARIAEELSADPLGIDPALPPSVYGFDAGMAWTLNRELEQCLGRELGGNVFAGDRSIRVVVSVVCGGANRPTALPRISRDAMRSEVVARAARRPRRRLDPGERPLGAPAGYAPRHRRRMRARDFAFAG